MILKPYKFKPLLKTVIWGGDKIVAFKGIESELSRVGESWELSGVEGHESVVDGGPDDGLTLSQLIARHGAELLGERVYRQHGTRFPLLVKLIDARRNLSVQVHPDDEMARREHGCDGKTEMWYVIDHEPGAKIMAGFAQHITPDDYDRMVADGTIMEAVEHHTSRRGQVYFLPAGRIHAIGEGNFIAEIQQTSDITYRVFDYNRVDAQGHSRELHTQLARQALDFADCGRCRPTLGESGTLVQCKYFTVSKLDVDGCRPLPMPDSCVVMMCVAGQATVVGGSESVASLRQGQTLLLPATMTQVALRGQATLLIACP